MKRTLVIAGITLRLLLRNGSAVTLAVLAAATATGIFWAARGDGSLTHELQMRLRYGLLLATGLINFALMYLGCVSLRRDLDQRHFHLMVAAPVHRAQIWLGKYLGMVILGVAAHLAAALALTVCCLIFVYRWEPSGERAAVRDGLLRTWAVHRPAMPPLEDLVESEFRRRLAELHEDHDDDCDDDDHDHDHDHDHGEPEWFLRQELLKEVRRALQMVPPNTPKTWRFRFDVARAGGEELRLCGKFYAERKDTVVHGRWELAAPGGAPTWTADFSGYPFQPCELRIPLAKVPPGPELELTFRGHDTPYLIFPVGEADGIRLLSVHGGVAANYLRLLLVSLVHLGLLLALALGLAAAFSYSVAVFVTFAAYFISVAADFFLGAMSSQLYGETGLVAAMLRGALRFGQGLKSPGAIENFAQGIALPLGKIFDQWGAAALTTIAMIGLLGIIVLTRKEIDRLLQS